VVYKSLYRLFALLLICIYSLCLRQADAFPHLSSVDDLQLLQSAALRCALNGQLDRSISLQQKAVGIAIREYGADSPAVADMYFHLGTLALEASEFQKAQDALSESVRINPTSVAARVKLAEILRLRGHPEAAQQQALTAVTSHKFAPEARQELALCYLDLGNMTKANQQFFNLSQIILGKPLTNSEPVSVYSSTAAPAAASSNNPMPAVQEEHSVIRSLTTHSRPSNPNAAALLNSTSAAQALMQKAYQQSLQMISKSKAHKSGASTSRSAGTKKHQHAAGNSGQKAHQGSLVPPPPEATPSYPGVVPVGSQDAASHSRSKKRTHTPSKSTDENTQGSAQESTQDDKGTPSQSSDFLLDWASVKNKK
jgi:tetratricopeptide (TPR) repeat protein